MARKNRKHGHEGHRGVFLGVALVALAAAVAMTYLSIHNTCESTGRQIKQLEFDKAELMKRVVNEERNWEMARSPARMEALMVQHGIAMSWPAEQNIIRLRAAEPDFPAQYALNGGSARRD
jgi:hypothetical protein